MHIIFQFGEFTSDESSFWSDLIVAIVGGFIGTGGAIWLYYRQTKDQKKKEQLTLSNLQKEQLEYLYHLINNVIRTADIMITELARFSESFSKKPSLQYDLQLTVNSDLNRIVNRINQDSYFLAYKALIKDNKIGKILSTIDFIFETLENIKIYYIKVHDIQENQRKEFFSLMQLLIKIVMKNRDSYKNSEGIEGEHYLFFDYYLKKYIDFFSPNINEIEIFDEKFLKPLLTHIKSVNTPVEYNEIFEAANSSSILLRTIILSNKSNGIHLGRYGQDLSQPIKSLKEWILPLSSYINIE